MTPYIITAIRDLPYWMNQTVTQLTEHNQSVQSYKDDMVKMLTEVFPKPHVVTDTKDKIFHLLPTIKLFGAEQEGLYDVVSVKITANGFLRLSLTISYTEKTWKQVKMVKSVDGKTYTIDREKMKAAADTLIAAYHDHYTRAAQLKSAEDRRNTAEVESFAALRPELESQGISFSNVRDDGRGGTILLTSQEHGPQIEIVGKTCVLKLASYARDSTPIDPGLIFAFSALFRRNSSFSP